MEYIAPKQDDLFLTVLEMCNVSVIEALDAVGCTPLHVVCCEPRVLYN